MKLRVLPVLAIFASVLFSCDLFTDGPGKDDPEVENFHVFSITPDAVTVPARGGEFEITVVSTQSEFDITIVDNWITEITRSGDRMKGETFRFSASANEGESARTGIVSVCTNEGVCVPVVITQPSSASSTGSKSFVHRNIGFRFTATWCGWCPYMDEAFHTVADDSSASFDFVTFHASAGYPLYLSDGANLSSYYKVQGYPTGVLNGWKEIQNYSTTSVTVTNIKNAITEFEGAFPCEAGIGISSTLNGNALEITATVDAVPGDYLISAFLLESGIVEAQARYFTTGGGETVSDFVHDNVARKTITSSPRGVAFEATQEEKVFEWVVLLNSAWSKTNLSIAVLVLKPYGTLSGNKTNTAYPDNYVVNAVIVPAGTTKEIEYAQ